MVSRIDVFSLMLRCELHWRGVGLELLAVGMERNKCLNGKGGGEWEILTYCREWSIET